jgi:hypothetical protein
MKSVILAIVILAIISIVLNGCGQPRKGYNRPSDTDVTLSPEYNFSEFAGTVWKTKVKVGLADIKLYTGRHVNYVLPPRSYDPTDPNYTPASDMQMIAVLPVGTRVRIERLMYDNGIAGLLWVTGSLEDGKVVYVSNYLLAKNRFIWPGSSDSKDWGGDPDMLEKAAP